MTRLVQWACAASILLPGVATAQANVRPYTWGDSTVVARTDSATRVIYDNARDKVYSLVAENILQDSGAVGTEVEGSFIDGRVARIVAGTWSPAGKHGIEFYFRNDSLIFTYESVQFTAGTATPNQWQNFRGIAAWERRIFWDAGRVAFVESRGRSGRPSIQETNDIIRRAARLRQLVVARARDVSRRPPPA